MCAAEDCHALEPVASRTPEDVFARCQVTQIVQQVLGELEQHYASLGKHEHFQRLKVWMDGRQAPYGVLSAEFGISAGTLRKQMFEMRLHFKSILFRHLKRRGVKSADIEDEIRGLIAALS